MSGFKLIYQIDEIIIPGKKKSLKNVKFIQITFSPKVIKPEIEHLTL